MSKSFLKNTVYVFLGVLVGFGVFTLGRHVGTEEGATKQASMSVLNADATSDIKLDSKADFSKFWQAWTILNAKYATTPKHPGATSEDKVYGAIKGLAESYGDPYTTFFTPVEEKQFREEISGNFEGVGMEVGLKNGVLTVISPLKGSPAEKAGIRAGDQVLKIGTTTVVDMSADAAVQLIRGKKGTKVVITVIGQKDKSPRIIEIVRDIINIPTIATKKLPDGIFVISLYSFTGDSANLFRNALQEFVHSGSNKLILDLRGNPGGYLDAAVDMASWFLPSTALVVKEDAAGVENDESLYSKGYNVFNKNLKMVILINEGSASASEILAGALKENGVASLVGTKSYGKGSVQELVPLDGKTSLKITIAQWLTPNGVSISEHGLEPDVNMPFTEKDIDAKIDPQINAAVKLLQGK
jgi:carboxyl-terminal processing protease